jgi:hypothetical protein
MKKIVVALLLFIISSSFCSVQTLKGTWQFVGGIYNGKQEGETKDYTLERRYSNSQFDAFVVEKGSKPEKYQSGYYTLKGDSCIETETFSAQPSKLTGIPVHYLYEIRHNSLILKGTLPTGMVVEEYWKRK